MQIKAISLYQPYASLIAYGFKQFETRSWKTSYRGKIAIHAGKNLSSLNAIRYNKYDNLRHRIACLYETEETLKLMEFLDDKDNFPLGRIVAIADLTNCREMVTMATDDPNKIGIGSASRCEEVVGHWERGRYAWELENVELFLSPPIKGQQGLFNIELPFDSKRSHPSPP